MSTDHTPNLHALGLLDNKNSGGGGGGAAQDKTNDGIGTHNTARTVHNVGVLAGAPVNLGSVLENGGAQQGMETEGLAGKNIPALFGNLDLKGGTLAKLLHDIFIKNFHTITDFATGLSAPNWVEVPIESLGNISPQTFASAAPSVGEGMSIG